MSDTIFHSAYVRPASRTRLPFLSTWHRGRKLLVRVGDTVETYSVVEATCLLSTMVFGAVFAAASFGVRI
jgi:hypothetical protein